MKGVSRMSDQKTSKGLNNVTSSQELESGRWRFVAPDGQMIGQSGLDRAHANLSARQAKEKGLLTSGTYGPPGSGSSESVDLTLCLGNKLRAVTDLLGSTLYRLTWKDAVTPSGRRLSLLRASALRTKEKDCSSWQTPCGRDGRDGRASDATMEKGSRPLNEQVVNLAGWPTTQVSTGDYQMSQGKMILKLSGVAKLPAWPTSKATDGSKGVRSHEGAIREVMRSRGPDLPTIASLANWATPAAQEAGGTPEAFLARKKKAKKKGAVMGLSLTSLSLQALLTDIGEDLNGSIVVTESGGQLNPEHSRWLQALPVAWSLCAPAAKRKRG